jgi:hypothetical protein
MGFGRALGLVHSAISNLKCTIRLPAAFAEENDVDGFEEDPEIKKEGQLSKREEIRLRFPIPPALFLTYLTVCSTRSTG